MKESSEVMTQEVDQEQVDVITEIAREQHQGAQSLNREMVEGKKSDYVRASVALSFSFGPDGGSCTAWITYENKRVLKFYAEATRNFGFPVSMHFAHHTVSLLSYDKLLNASAEYYAKGFNNFGALTMNIGNRQVTRIPIPVAGLGYLAWSTEGKGKFTEA